MEQNYQRGADPQLLPVASSQEQRRSHRVKIRRVICVLSCAPGGFSELETTENISRDGLFFVTRRSSYYKGLKLIITFPGLAPLAYGGTYPGHVARIVEMSGGRIGVGVHLERAIEDL